MRKVTLGSLCDPPASAVSEDDETIIDYIDISSVDNVTKRITGYQTLKFVEAPSRARKGVKTNSILVSTVRPNLNAVAIVDKPTPNKTVASTGFCVLDCKEKVCPSFVFNFCRSKPFIEEMISQATGASYPAVSDKIVRSALIPDYSYSEQQAISSTLDKVDKVIQGKKRELALLDDLIKARFVEMFGAPFNSFRWPTKQLKDISESISDGSNVDSAFYLDSGDVLFLRIQNVWCNEFRLDDSVYLSKRVNEKYYETSLKRGDLLITKIGRYYTADSSLGRVSVYLGDDDKANYSNNIMRVRLKNGVNSEYVNALMNLDDYNRFIRRTSVGGTDKRALSKALIGSYPIIFPPISLQNDYVRFVHKIEKAKSVIQKSLDDTQLLFDSLMQKYFG